MNNVSDTKRDVTLYLLQTVIVSLTLFMLARLSVSDVLLAGVVFSTALQF